MKLAYRLVVTAVLAVAALPTAAADAADTTMVAYPKHFYLGKGSTDPFSLEGQWLPVDKFGGVTVEAMYRRELRDQIIVQIKLVNTNRYKVTVGITPGYQCPNQDTTKPATAMTLFLAPGEAAVGQDAGLYDYPCKGTLPPVKFGYEKLYVTHTN